MLTHTQLRQFNAKIDTTGECHFWKGPSNNKGYGRFVIRTDGRLKQYLAHRIVFVLHGGDPNVPVVRHRCDQKNCVRVDHLIGGTVSDNAIDAVTRGQKLYFGRTARWWRDWQEAQRLVEMFWCTHCEEYWLGDNFHRNSTAPNGRQGWCNSCRGYPRSAA